MNFPKTIYWMQRTLLPAHDVGGVSGPSKRQEIEKCRWPDAWHECVWLQDPLAYTIWNAVLLLLVAKRKPWGGGVTVLLLSEFQAECMHSCAPVLNRMRSCAAGMHGHTLAAVRWPLAAGYRMWVELLIGFQMVGHHWLLRGGNCCDSRDLLTTRYRPATFLSSFSIRPQPSISRPRTTLLQP